MAKDCKHKGDCCGYSCELYALDKNKRIERSLKRPFGRSFAQACSCCKSCCYDRRCLARGYIYYFLILLTGIILLPIGIYEFSRINAAKEFKPTNCTTISSSYTGQYFTCNTCGGKNKNRPECFSKYPCLKVMVSYPAGSAGTEVSILMDQWKTLGENQECMFFRTSCEGYNPEEKVESLMKDYAVGTTFDCYYNPEKVSEVIIDLHPTSSGIAFVVVGVLGLIVGFILLLITTCVCGCKGVWCCHPPQELLAELAQKQNQQQGQQLGHPHQTPPPPYHQQSPQGQVNNGFTQDYSSAFQEQNYKQDYSGFQN